MAQTVVMIEWYVMLLPPSEIRSPSKKARNPTRSSGGQIQSTAPIKPTSRPTLTMIFVTSLDPCNPRKMTRSMNAPNSGANTNRTRISEIHAGHFQSKRICQ